MIRKRPHTLKYVSKGDVPIQDGDGNWIPGTAGESVELGCRYEPNGAGRSINGTDGTVVIYNGIVYLPSRSDAIPFGITVEVFEGDEKIASGSVLRFSKGQMNCRLWV
ncbi:hypothetical protein GCM10023149_48480 [Mucilaginibacter gynuensis]|uniref:Uncharacterized protein n=1 Tax=Mucilaginibacter gynuensis TaxID=1302236 RepID=A0ABP8HFH7_9SPHI